MCQPGAMELAKVIICVDCGGKAHLMHEWPESDPPRPGDIAIYRCEECMDRWDIVIEDDDVGPVPGSQSPGA